MGNKPLGPGGPLTEDERQLMTEMAELLRERSNKTCIPEGGFTWMPCGTCWRCRVDLLLARLLPDRERDKSNEGS